MHHLFNHATCGLHYVSLWKEGFNYQPLQLILERQTAQSQSRSIIKPIRIQVIKILLLELFS